MSDEVFLSAAKQAGLIRQGKLSSETLLNLYLERIERLNDRITAIIALDIPEARKRAREADEALIRGTIWGPLHGVPITLQDTFDVPGMPSTWGVPDLKDNYPAKHAPAAEKFLEAGAVIFGKTNISAYHIGVATKNDVYGITRNPWNTDRSPGGSSGGAGAAIAAGLSSLDMGVDFSGGIRNIAHFTGIFAHKPTYGITNLMGTVLAGIGEKPDLAVIGPLARSTDDLRIALSLITGPASQDACAWSLELPPARSQTPKGLRIAVMCEHPQFMVDDTVKGHIQSTADFLANKGAQINDMARPAIDMMASFRVFMGLLTMPLSARRQDKQFWSRLTHMTNFVGSGGGGDVDKIDERDFFSHANWMKLDMARHMVCAAWREFFEEFDLLICPASPCPAMPADPEKDWHERNLKVGDRPLSVAEATTWGALATLGNLPATVAPAGITPDGLPIGVQIIGPEYGDETCLALSAYLEQNYHPYKAPPGWN